MVQHTVVRPLRFPTGDPNFTVKIDFVEFAKYLVNIGVQNIFVRSQMFFEVYKSFCVGHKNVCKRHKIFREVYNKTARDLADTINHEKFCIYQFNSFGVRKGQSWGSHIGNRNGPFHYVLHYRAHT